MYFLLGVHSLLRFLPHPLPPRLRLTGGPCVDTRLSAYLAARLGRATVEFAEPPALVPDGWEAYIYRFRPRPVAGLPRRFDRPLVLRLYAGPHGLARARREFSAQCHVFRHGYPVPEPLLLEEDSDLLGGPFLVMEQVPGPTLLDRLRTNWTRILAVPAQLARLHARLHALPPDGLANGDGPFLGRQLDELRRTTRTYDLDGLTAGLRWLNDHRPPDPDSPCLLHLDFHPVNLIARADGEGAVLDWSEADVGDRHADLAMTTLMLRCAPVEGLAAHERLVAPLTRWLLARRYRVVYRRRAPFDRERLRYYFAWACLRRLATYGMWLRAGPLTNGSKPGALGRVTPRLVRELAGWFERASGIGVDLSVRAKR
ncbi:MAG TPA: phosphotransferase [Gemmataceae bacterium]|nr:phosphotransferase [Gemmataceae bacterium]